MSATPANVPANYLPVRQDWLDRRKEPILEPDLPRVSLVWHSALECHANVYKLDKTSIRWHMPGMDEDAGESVDNLLDLV